jgi:hypothetical protein
MRRSKVMATKKVPVGWPRKGGKKKKAAKKGGAKKAAKKR